ncbi:thioesterase family protein [Corynebacterium hindlerae]|uniref:Thioesterase family protein n=1 Tax=Corynebacterium hindlerae TaxID=699041 RepID=A0A7G5FGQ6_9CORY|nr:thioesterase family protein [Corynebacterium hindlerae]QMV85797.1 thioesterase family protein [Corynebacterium hindlerae]
MTNSFFTRISGDTYAPTIHAEGAWSTEDYHFASLAGLMTHVIEQHRVQHDGGKLELSRISFDILGRLPFQEVSIEVEVKRPGRTIELVEAVATIGDRPVIIARAWYLMPSDTADVAGVEYEALPAPEECPERPFSQDWGGGYIAQVVARQAVEKRAGRGATWLTSPNTLVDGDTPIAIAEFINRVDPANGINPRQSPKEWAFPNVDLTIHLFRQPAGEWTGLDTAVSWGAHGIGLTASTLHDIHGPVGRAEQSLTLRKM